jgi:hypothetical protein
VYNRYFFLKTTTCYEYIGKKLYQRCLRRKSIQVIPNFKHAMVAECSCQRKQCNSVCPVDHRWCNDCDDYRPLNEFYTINKSHCCKKHMSLRSVLYMNKLKEFPDKNNLGRIWKFAYEDNRAFFADTNPSSLKKSPHLKKHEIQHFFKQADVNITEFTRLAPIDPSKPISVKNACIVSLPTRLALLAIWKHTRSSSFYSVALESQRIKPIPT